MSKKIICLILTIGMTISLLACGDNKSELYECSVDGCTEQVYKNGLCPDHYVEMNREPDADGAEEKKEETIENEMERKEDAYKASTTENDTDIGLKNIKFDTAKPCSGSPSRM